MFTRNLCWGAVGIFIAANAHAMGGRDGGYSHESFEGQQAMNIAKSLLAYDDVKFLMKSEWWKVTEANHCRLAFYRNESNAQATECYYDNPQFVPQNGASGVDQSFCGIGKLVGEKNIFHTAFGSPGVSKSHMDVPLTRAEYESMERSLVGGSEKNLKCESVVDK